MQIKNKKKIPLIIFLILFALFTNAKAEEFNLTAKEILIDKDKEVLTGMGSVVAIDNDGNKINADKIIYNKSTESLIAEGNVRITDNFSNTVIAEKANFDKINGIISTFGNTEILMKEGYKLNTKNLLYNTFEKIISSNDYTIFTDSDGNNIKTSMFQHDITKNIFSSVGKIKIIDANKNKYLFKELHIDTKKKEMIGSDVSVAFNQKNFGVNKENDPRFVANDIYITKNKSHLSKAVFTVCKKRDKKCPPWSIKAKKITHDKVKKTIYYKNAILKFYDVPIFYFPRFFHPDPTIKRQSGFLAPFFTNSTTVGTGSAIPYYWMIDKNKDLTFTTKTYTKESLLYLNEYRQAFKNGFLTLDTSFTEGYKNTSSTKTAGSRNHIFGNLNLNLNQDDTYESNLILKVQKTSNDTYLRVHDIKTELVDPENTTLENEIKYTFSKNDMYIDLNASVFEDQRTEKRSDKYEYILPNILYGKKFFSEKYGTIDFTANALHSNYDTNKYKTFLTNDINWTPSTIITKDGFVNTFEGMIRNTNYSAKKTEEFKNQGTVNEINGVLSYKSSLPMKKDDLNTSRMFSPNFMLRYAPGHMRSLSSKDVSLNYTNLYSLNKTSEIEDGLSAILGIDYKINEKKGGKTDIERLSLSIGQVFNYEKNNDMPSKSSLDQEMSDVVGDINYNFSEIGSINYKFSLDNNLNDLNNNDISTKLNFGKVQFNLDYLEQQNHIGTEHYASSGLTLNFDDYNKLSFSTKKNFKTDSTELYDLSYQYGIDCLTAGVAYRREFYQDSNDLQPTKNTFMLTFTFIPFATVKTPSLKQ